MHLPSFDLSVFLEIKQVVHISRSMHDYNLLDNSYMDELLCCIYTSFELQRLLLVQGVYLWVVIWLLIDKLEVGILKPTLS